MLCAPGMVSANLEYLAGQLLAGRFTICDTNEVRVLKLPCGVFSQFFYGVSHRPESAERKMASMTAMFLMASSSGTGTSLFS
jgi:hypothetical protein